MSAGDIFNVTLVQQTNATRFANTFHFSQAGGTDSPDPKNDLAELIEDELVPLFQACCSAQWSALCVHVRKVGLAGQDYFRRVFTGLDGDVADEALPSDVAQVLELLTAVLGRGGSGRLFVGGIPQNVEDDNAVNQAQVDLLNLVGAWLCVPHNATTWIFQAGLLRPAGNLEFFVAPQAKSACTLLKSRKPDFEC